MTYEKIWKKALGEDEKIEYEFSIGDRYLKILLIVSTLIIISMMFVEKYSAMILLLMVSFYCLFYAKASNAYALTSKRVLIHTGWLSTNLVSIEYKKITDINVGEPFFERIVAHTGYLKINTAGTSQEEVILLHIDNPYEIKKKIDRLKED